MPEDTPIAAGRVYLVGAGPGDPGLLTLRGAECLGRADVVLFDYLVNPRTLAHAREDAERVCLGRHGHGRIMSQAEVNERMIAAARAGRIVVRLKGGDPLIFARAAEECAALAAARVPYEIVPGITVALAAGAYAGIPLTDRECASAVALVVGREDAEKDSPPLDYAALASFPGTLVFYMGVTTVAAWSDGLLRGGMAAATPVAIVRRCSWPDQTLLRTTLGEVASAVVERKVRPPVIAIVGDVAASSSVSAWFTARPLFGRRIVVTRPEGQADPLRARLEELGAEVMVQPAIDIGPPIDIGAVDKVLARIDEFDWVVFSSANGVRKLLDRLLAGGAAGRAGEGTHGAAPAISEARKPADVRRLGSVRIAAIGPATADELGRYGLTADVIPAQFRAEELAAALAPHVDGRRVLLVRASRGREVLAEQLRAAGATVEQVVVYESRDVTECDPHIAAALADRRIDCVTVTSSAIARSTVRLLGAAALAQTRLASISPITSATLDELGCRAAIEAAIYTSDGLVAAILAAFESA